MENTAMMLFLFAGATLVLLLLIRVATAAVFLVGLRMPDSGLAGRVTLVLPLTGTSFFLPTLLHALSVQTLQPRRLIIVVESMDDPAWNQASQACTLASFPVEICVAGLAERCSQKGWNLIAAVRLLDGEDDAVVFFDADIMPQPSWLSLLATPILAGKADIVTGYRWAQIGSKVLSHHFVAVIDRQIAMLPALQRFRLVWGGSMAFSASALAALDLPNLLSRTLSDDCTIGLRACQLGLRVLTRRLLRVPSHPPDTFFAAWKFGHRQYQIIHVHRPGLWWLALVSLTLRLSAWVLVFATFSSLMQLILLLLVVLLIDLIALWLQQVAARRLGLEDAKPVQRVQWLVTLAEPLLTGLHWSMVMAAGWTRIIRWGHVQYRVDGPDAVEVLARTPWDAMGNQG